MGCWKIAVWVTGQPISSHFRLVGGWWLSHPSEKYEFVSWDDYSQYIENKSHVPKHQPAPIVDQMATMVAKLRRTCHPMPRSAFGSWFTWPNPKRLVKFVPNLRLPQDFIYIPCWVYSWETSLISPMTKFPSYGCTCLRYLSLNSFGGWKSKVVFYRGNGTWKTSHVQIKEGSCFAFGAQCIQESGHPGI